MKSYATKRLLALLLTLAMVFPIFAGAVLDVQADTITAEPNVYDIYDLTGSVTNTFKGTDETWDGQIHKSVSEEHKENIVFKTKLTMGEQEMRLSINALDGASIYDPSGYAVYLNHNGGAPYIAIKRNQTDLVVSSVSAVAGTYELEIGLVDILTDGVRTGKHLYVKKDGVVVSEVDDTNGYLTGDALGTKIIDFHYGAAIRMDTTYTSGEGNVYIYDIYDLTGAASNTIKGTNETWDGQIHANVSEEHKENIVFKTKLTMGEQEVRLSINALDGASIYDPSGYSVFIHHNGGAPYIAIKRNMRDLVLGSVAAVAGTWELEIGLQDILTNGVRTGKHLYVKKDGVVVCEADDTDGYFTGDALGTKIIDFHYGAAIQMDTTYTKGYGSANAYDIYDLTGATAKRVDPWASTKIGSVAEDHKEQAAVKMNMNITDARHRYRFSVGAAEGVDCTDPQGYGMEIAVQFDGQNHIKFLRNNSLIATFSDVSGLIGEHDIEFGCRNITMDNKIAGKQVYLSVDGVDLYTYDDGIGYLTGDTLGTMVALHHIDDSAVKLNSTYESGYGTEKVYDVYDLTGKSSNTINGTGNGNWSATVLGNIDAADKENVSFKANVNITDEAKYRFSLGALDSDDCVDPAGYGFELVTGASGYVAFIRGSSHTWLASWDGDTTNLKGEYVLEFGYRDIFIGENIIGKQIFLKKDGEVLYSFDDMNGFLTGDSLGTKAALFHYGTSVQMDTTLPSFVDSYNLTLGGSTVMNLRLDPAIIGDAAATVTVSVGGVETAAYALQDLSVDAQGLYVVSVPLAAAQMRDDVTLTVNLTSGKSMTRSYTVAGYAKEILDGSSYTAEQKAVVEAMLHYGAAAQKYFGYNTENLANVGYTDSVTNTIGSAFAPSMTGEVDGVAYYGASLLMQENISLRHYLNITGDVNSYSFVFNGVEVTPVATSKVSGANYYVQLDDILPDELDGVYVLTISANGNTFTVNYSPMSYIQRMSENENMKELVQQMYDYHIAAKALAEAA